jgi:hypothetical protein
MRRWCSVKSNAPKTTSKEQSKRFIEAAHEAGCSEDEAVFNENLTRIATAKPKPKSSKTPKSG